MSLTSAQLNTLVIATQQMLGGPQFKVGAKTIMPPEPKLGPKEALSVARAVPKRRLEFASGRSLARSLLSELNQSCSDIPRASTGCPEWPAGTWGSISHSHQIVVAAVRKGSFGFGIDIEDASPLSADLHRYILHPNETKSWPDQQTNQLAKVVFSAKESFYKAQYPKTYTLLDFLDVSVDLDLARQQFSVRLLATHKTQISTHRMVGHWMFIGAYLLSTARFYESDEAIPSSSSKIAFNPSR